MFKNVSGQKLTVFAFDSTTNLPKVSDAANMTAYVDKDDGGVTVLADTSATEKDSTNAKGYYAFDLAQAETNADKLLFSAKSSTSNIVVIGVPSVVYTLPSGIGDLTIANNAVAANVTRLLGTAWLPPGTAGTPDVNVKLWNALTTVALPLVPTTAGRTLDVSAGGEAGLDWANVGSPTTTVGLSGTTVGITSLVSALAADSVNANALATDAVVEIRNAITGGAYALNTDSGGNVKVSDGTGANQIDTSSGGIAHVILTDTLTTYTSNTPQTGDSFAYLGTNMGLLGANLTAADDAVMTRIGAPVGASISADVAAVQADTDNLQTRIPASLVSGRIDASVGAMASNVMTAAAAASDFGAELQALITGGAYALQADASGYVKISDGTGTGQIDTTSGGVLVSALATQAKADVNAEVVDTLATDTYAEMPQGTPAATASITVKLNWLYMAWRNKKTQTSTDLKLFADDASTVVAKSAVSDDLTTFTAGEFATGP